MGYQMYIVPNIVHGGARPSWGSEEMNALDDIWMVAGLEEQDFLDKAALLLGGWAVYHLPFVLTLLRLGNYWETPFQGECRDQT